jgi:hypothetical protein
VTATGDALIYISCGISELEINQLSIDPTHPTLALRDKQGSIEIAMAYVAQLLLLVLCTLTYHSLGAADATGSLKAEAVCAEPQGTRAGGSLLQI